MFGALFAAEAAPTKTRNKKKPGQKAGQENGTSLGMLIPNGPLREASEPAPGYSAFLKKRSKSSSLTHSLILIKDQPFEFAG